MATLVLDADSAHALASPRGATVSMRSWLDGRWALLLSHPDDFIRSESDIDRWIEDARHAFQAAGVRPLAVARLGQEIDTGWVTRVCGDPRIVVLHEPGDGCSAYVDRGALRLHEEIAGTGGRFVMIVDPALRPHRTFVYSDLDDLPSPLDLIPRVATARLALNRPPRVAPAVLEAR